jgi:hypothetical protein
MYVQVSPAGIKARRRWNLIGHGNTAPPSVVAQQYSSATFLSLRFHPREESVRRTFRKRRYSSLCFYVLKKSRV